VPASTLRDRTRLTRLLILRELVTRPEAPLRELAATLEVTPQAVSTHVKKLMTGGLLVEQDGHRVVTPDGMQALMEGFQEIKRLVDHALEPLPLVQVADAIAAAPVTKGQRVGLVMEDGRLMARPGVRAASTGVAVADAAAGQDVIVRDLSGVVELTPGRLLVVRVPGPETGGSRRVDMAGLRLLLKAQKARPARVGAVGLGATVVVRRLGWSLDFEFAAPSAAFHACELGLETALIVSEDRLKEVVAVLDARNAATIRRVRVDVVEAPRRAATHPANP
jgi:putative transcriptional regulator